MNKKTQGQKDKEKKESYGQKTRLMNQFWKSDNKKTIETKTINKYNKSIKKNKFLKKKNSCLKCGLPLSFKKLLNGKWYPTNPDGSEHWDLCSKTYLKISGKNKLPGYNGIPVYCATTNPKNKKPEDFYCCDQPPWD